MCKKGRRNMYLIRTSVGKKRVSIGAWWPNESFEKGWSLAPVQEQKDIEDYPLLAMGLRDNLRGMGVHRCYATNVAEFSGNVLINPNDLRKEIDLGKNILMYRDRSIKADGIRIPRGRALIASGRGCPFIVATSDEYMFVAHAGRDSMIDRGVIDGKPTRGNISVVESLIEAFLELGVPAEEITMRMEFSIPATVFEHRFNGPDGEHNHKLWEFIQEQWPTAAVQRNGGILLDLEELFERQAREAGVTDARAENSLPELPNLVHSRNSTKSNLFVFKND